MNLALLPPKFVTGVSIDMSSNWYKVYTYVSIQVGKGML